MTWDHESWIKAWGWNAPLIVGGVNDELFRMPAIPENYNWIIIREIAGPPKKPEPAYWVSLGEFVKDKDRAGDWGYQVRMLSCKQFVSTGDLGKTRFEIEAWAAQVVEDHIEKEK